MDRTQLEKELPKKEIDHQDKIYADRARSIRSEEDLRKVSKSSIINKKNYEEIERYFQEEFDIKIVGFENKDLF